MQAGTQKAEVKADKAEAKADKAEAKADKAAGSAAKDEGSPSGEHRRHDGSPGSPGQRMRSGDMPGSAAAKSNDATGASSDQRGMAAPGMRRSAMRALREGIKDGSIKKEELKGKLEELRQSEQQRRREHQELVRQRWGSTLSLAPAEDELRQHARRSALLDRALVVAQTEAKVSDQARLINRIEMLIAKENSRHERAMMRLSSMRSAPGGASAPAGSASAVSNQGGVQ